MESFSIENMATYLSSFLNFVFRYKQTILYWSIVAIFINSLLFLTSVAWKRNLIKLFGGLFFVFISINVFLRIETNILLSLNVVFFFFGIAGFVSSLPRRYFMLISSLLVIALSIFLLFNPDYLLMNSYRITDENYTYNIETLKLKSVETGKVSITENIALIVPPNSTTTIKQIYDKKPSDLGKKNTFLIVPVTYVNLTPTEFEPNSLEFIIFDDCGKMSSRNAKTEEVFLKDLDGEESKLLNKKVNILDKGFTIAVFEVDETCKPYYLIVRNNERFSIFKISL